MEPFRQQWTELARSESRGVMLTGYEEEENNILQCGRKESQAYVNGELIIILCAASWNTRSIQSKKREEC